MKKFISLLLTFCIISSFSITCFAETEIPEAPTSEIESVIEPRAEEVEWIYVVRDGMLMARLWSYTRGIWLTDWEIIGPAPEGM